MASVDALSREEVWQTRGIKKKGRMVEAQQTGPRKKIIWDLISHGKLGHSGKLLEGFRM